MTRIVVHIDRLVLNGFQREDREAIARGLRSELEQRLNLPGAADRLAGSGNASRLSVDGVHVPHGGGGASLGIATARAITSRWTPAPRRSE